MFLLFYSGYNIFMTGLFSSWQILITISVITFSLSTLLQRVLMKNNKTDSVAYSLFFQICTGMVILIYAFIHGFRMPNLLLYPINTLIMISFYAAANIFVFKSLSLIEASEFTILFVSRAFWTILAAVLFLGEKFLPVQILGTLLVILGVIFVSYRKKSFTLNKGSIYALLGAVFLGLAFTNDAFLVSHFDAASYTGIAFILPGLGIAIYSPKSLLKMKSLFKPSILIKLVLLSIVYGTAALTVYLAYQLGHNAAVLGALSQTSTILTVLLAVIFLKETSQLWKKVLGAIIAFIGVVLIG